MRHAMLRTALHPAVSQGRLAQRVLKLLWTLTTAPAAPPEVVRCNALRDVLRQYDDAAMAPYVLEYLVECVRRIELGDNAVAAMHMLSAILGSFPVASPKQVRPACAAACHAVKLPELKSAHAIGAYACKGRAWHMVTLLSVHHQTRIHCQ